MARSGIRIRDIHKYHRDSVVMAVKQITLEWEKRCINETPVDTGNLRNAWRSNIQPLLGEITNPVEYAEAVCYGINLPYSWENAQPSGWRTLTPSPTGNRVGKATRQGFPDLIGKELQGRYLQRILRRR